MSTMKELGLDKLSVDEREALGHELLESIAAEASAHRLTDEVKADLDHRLADLAANPDDVVPWRQARAAALTRHAK